MPSNPIQRKTRNSFLLGMVVMLIIAVIIVMLLYLTLFKNSVDSATSKGEHGKAFAYRLTSAVKSGEDFSLAKLELVEFYVDDLPSDYINNPEITKYKSKLNLQAGTILSSSLIYSNENEIKNSTRLMEYNMLTLPSTLRAGDYVDIRLMMPSGENYIVLSKKQIKRIKDTTITLYLTEDEILMMSSAIIENYIMKASDLYVTQYIEAGVQNASTPTYSVSSEVYQLIQNNAQKGYNIEDYAKINSSYSGDLRQTIEKELSQYTDSRLPNVEEGITEQKEKAKSAYLDGLSGY